MDKRPALGKGLSALIPDEPVRHSSAAEIDIDRISPNEFQPRIALDESSLAELAHSIKAHGIIQPIVVRKSGERFQIIAGERRWRAARQAGLLRVPVVIKDIAPGREGSLLEMALVENIQRENLNPIDEAIAYRRLADEFQLTQEDIAAAVGKDRASIANHIRLLRLPDEVKTEVAAGRLSMGHARALLAVADEAVIVKAARDVIARGLSVRETEALVKKLAAAAPSPQPVAGEAGDVRDVHTRAAEERLRLILGTRVRIVRRGTRGRIEIDFGSEDELIRVYDQLTEKG
jgi:ParB family chromosome partitioning protein